MNTEPIARQIVEQLAAAGHTAYYAGGCVRDRLLGLPSSDYDVATDASPEEVQQLFPHTVPVGIEFGSVIVVIEGLPTEVTTFRNDIHHDYEGGRRPHQIERATPEEDAQRRSFTINGIFFDPLREEVIDYVEGQVDLERGIIRAIGDPDLRFKEDRLRMIRGVRFAARFQFAIETRTEQAIRDHAHLLFPAVSMERIWQELHKMAAHNHFAEAMRMLQEFRLLPEIFPLLRDLPSETITSDLFLEEGPLVARLLPLFRSLNLEERTEMVARCKPAKAELQMVEFLTKAEQLLKEEPSCTPEWVAFYAHPSSELAIEAAANKGPLLEWKERLAKPIARAKERRPLVTSQMLRKVGIKPGPEMGQRLKEAERIAIEQELTDPEEVIKAMLGEEPSQ